VRRPLRKDTSQSVAARLHLDASKPELSHSTPLTTERFVVRQWAQPGT
jgi:hypothetical protein